MNEKKVSIIMASYNSAALIKESILSVLAQSYDNFELLIIDDASTDNSLEVINKIKNTDKRIKLIALENNQGAAVSRNKGIENAEGQYIAFLDSDDLWLPEKLEKQISFMQQKNLAFSYTYYKKIDDKGQSLNQIVKSPRQVNYKTMLKANFIGCLTVIYDSAKLGKQYFPLLRKRQDYALWLKILKQIDFGYCLPEILSQYRVRSHSISHSKFDNLKYNWKLYRKIEQFNPLKSLYYLSWNIFIKLFRKK